ncbi:GMP synthase [bacterium]|jgi:GMP synthase (glutamine-hydrolysing)|nr:GMP synthase [bacterium]
MNLHVIMHESFEVPGAIETWAQKNNHQISYTRLYNGDQLPDQTNNFDYLVVLGGPQSPATTLEECPHFDAGKEIALIKKSIDDNKLVLGVCLGAQLIGEALGAKFEHSPDREIGVFNITMTDAATNDPIFSSFPPEFLVGHWHGDMPGLTKDSEVLAFSKGCPRQIVKYTPRVYGFQCHFEFTLKSIEGMITNCAQELEDYKELPFVQNEDDLRGHDYDFFNKLLFEFLDKSIELNGEN